MMRHDPSPIPMPNSPQALKVRSDADLVEILQAVDLESEIPIQAFQAVAEILAYVYRANGMMPPSGAKP